MKNQWIVLFLFTCLHGQAQYKVTFRLQGLPSYHAASEAVYAAGNFNGWHPDSAPFRFTGRTLVIQVPKGVCEYKFTRGSWQTVETKTGGMAVENRKLMVEKDTTLAVEIKDWADHFASKEKKSTASKNVHVIDTAFYMPQLARHRRVWIYLPASYAVSRKKYPVLYMHDGQNVFDDSTSYAGEWGVDEALDGLDPHMHECIVVAVDNGGEKRMNEYSPFDMEKWGNGEGDAYADFIVKTLKPYIQTHYRVKRYRKHQAIAGSSMGGLISFYILLKYPKAFGGAGIFSPSFWIAPQQVNELIAAKAKSVRCKIYFYAGKAESERMVPDVLAVLEQTSKASKAKMTSVIRTGGEHNETRWRQEFPLFYKWLLEE